MAVDLQKYDLHWQMEFVALDGAEYTVYIYDDEYRENEVVMLQPASVPFEIEMADDDDFFLPIRSSTGYLRIVTEDYDLANEIAPSTAQERYIEVHSYTGHGDVIEWGGFLSQENYSQPLDNNRIEVEFPLISSLESLKHINYPVQYNVRSIKDLILEACEYLPQISYAYFATNVNDNEYSGTDELDYAIDDSCFEKATEADYNKYFGVSGNIVEPSEKTTYYNVLEEICKYMGWSVSEEGDELIFSAVDYGNTYRVLNISTGNITTEVRRNLNFSEFNFGSANNDQEFLQGKRYVSIEADTNLPDKIFELDFDDNEVSPTSYWGLEVTPDDYAKRWVYDSNGNDISDSYTLGPRVYNSVAGRTSFESGGEIYLDYENYSDNSYTPCFYITGTETDAQVGKPAVWFKTDKIYCGKSFLNGLYLNAKVTCAKARDDDEYSSSPYQNITVQLKWGDKYYNGDTWQDTACTFTVYAYPKTQGDTGSTGCFGWMSYYIYGNTAWQKGFGAIDGKLINVDPSLRGQIEITFYTYKISTYSGVDYKGYTLMLKDLTLTAYEPVSSNRHIRKDYDTVRYRANLDATRQEDYTRSNLLFTPYEPMTSLYAVNRVNQDGYDYPKVPPESLLLARVKKWYNRTIEKLTVTFRYDHDSPTPNCGQLFTFNGHNYAVTALTQNFVDCSVKVTLQRNVT